MMPKACPVPQRSTLVADIDAANRLLNRTACHHGDDRKLLRLLNEQLHDLQHKAAIAFAEDNGWKLAKSAFGVSKLGSFGPDYGCYGSTEIFDHCLHFRSHGQNVAIVAQPYSKTLLSIFDAKQMAQSMGLACHVPPQPWCSFWFPRWTLFLVFTKPDQPVIWLPEQTTGIPDQKRVHYWRAAA